MSNEMLMKGMPVKDVNDLTYPVWVEQKLDEVRCRVYLDPATNIVEFDSYAGKPLHNLKQFFGAQFYEFMQDTGIYELDVGVLVNNNFNDSYRWVRSSKGVPPEKLDKATGKIAPALNEAMVRFYLYDMPTRPNVWKTRRVDRNDVCGYLEEAGLCVDIPQGQDAPNAEALLDFFAKQRALGLEGIMVKSYEHKYQRGKHTGSWWKMKPSDTIDGKIVGYTEAVSLEGVPLGRVGSVDVVMDDGSKASPGGFSHALAKDIFDNFDKYRDQWLEFDFMERDRQGGYRHPHFKRFREAK